MLIYYRVISDMKDFTILKSLMDVNFDLRRRLFGDDVIGHANLDMVTTARSVGGALIPMRHPALALSYM